MVPNMKQSCHKIDFKSINGSAISQLPRLVTEWLPQGRREGNEWVALNPRRSDCHLGSFKINIHTGKWADFASDDRGGDPISLYAYLFDLSQAEAAKCLIERLGVRYV